MQGYSTGFISNINSMLGKLNCNPGSWPAETLQKPSVFLMAKNYRANIPTVSIFLVLKMYTVPMLNNKRQ